MIEVRLKDIKAFPAVDLTNASFEEIDSILARGGKRSFMHSCGVYGVSGVVVEIDGEFYNVTARTSALWQVM